MLNAELRVISGKQAGSLIPLSSGRFLIGREEDCHLRPGNDLVSRHHCVFKTDEYSVRIRDLGSTNGTFVNGERLNGEIMLNTGDQVKVGTLEFEVLVHEGSETPAETDAQAAPVTIEGEPDASQTMVEMPVTGGEDSSQDLAAMQETGQFHGDTVHQAPPPAADPNQQQPGQVPQPAGYQMPYPQQPFMYGQPYGMPMGYPQQPMPYPPMYPQQPMGMPQQPYPQQPQPAAEEPAAGESSGQGIDVALPDPSTTGAKPPEPPAADGAKSGAGGGGGEVSTTAQDIIKQYTQRRPATGKK